MSSKHISIYFLLAIILAIFAKPAFAYGEYQQQQRYAKDLLNQAKDDYDRQMIYCRKNSVFSNSCAEKAKTEYLKRRRSAENIMVESKTNERRMRRDEYNRRQADKRNQFYDKQYRDHQRGIQYQQDYQRKQLEKQRKFAEKQHQRQEKYLQKQQQREQLYRKQASKRAERDRRMESYYKN